MSFTKLISGTDFRGTAVGELALLTPERAEALAWAFATHLRSQTKIADELTIGVGHDSRVTATSLSASVIRGLGSANCTVLFAGLASTPSMFMMTKFEQTKAHGSVMITASHHPSDKNGLKFFSSTGGLEHEDIEAIARLAEMYVPSNVKANIITKNYMMLYANFLQEIVREGVGNSLPLKGLKIVVDAGNGAGGFYATNVLQPLGADVSGSQFLEPDGMFPNHAPNPENAKAMQSIVACVRQNSADLGIIFDTDVDRSAIVDHNGTEYNKNRLIALVSAITLRSHKGATIVTDSITSDSLTQFINSRGGVHHRFKRGYKNVINEAIRLNNDGQYAPIAIETSGHCAFINNHFLDDGAYLATMLVIELANQRANGKDLDHLTQDLVDASETTEFRLGFKNAEGFSQYGKEVIDNVKKNAGKYGFTVDASYEGVRLKFDGGWCLIRMSVHDPNMPINIECDQKGQIDEVKSRVINMLKEYNGLLF